MIIEKETEERIKRKVLEILKRENVDLIEFKIFYREGSFCVKVMVDFPYGGITLGDCAYLNRLIFSYIDKEAILGDDFIVEVVSPGTDRKLKERSDFLRVLGRDIKIWLKSSYKGKSYYEGVLKKVGEEEIIIEKGELFSIPLSLINFAKQRIE